MVRNDMPARTKQRWAGVVFLAVASFGCKQTRPKTMSSVAEIRNSLDRAVEPQGDRPFNGVVLVTQGQDIAYDVAVGVADRSTSTPVTLDAGFIIGSLSKQFTAVLVLQQFDAGTLSLDGVVAVYLPELREAWATSATIAQLLNHTSGVSEVPGESGGVPGAAFRYSNRGYLLLGEILEQATGRPFEKQLVELARWCGMKETPILSDERRARGYVEVERMRIEPVPPGVVEVPLPAGGIASTAPELARWNRCLHAGHVVSSQNYRRMVEATAYREHRWGLLGYGYGLQLSAEDGIVEYSHSGYLPGFISTSIYYPRSRVSVVILENTSWGTDDMERVFSVHDRIREIVRDSPLVDAGP